MTYLQTIWTSLLIIANIVIALLGAALFAYVVYRCLPRRIRCKIVRWVREL